MKTINWIAYVLLIIGGLNWGLVGLFNYNLVNEIFGSMGAVERIIYVLVGLAALWAIFAIHPASKPKTIQPVV